jgi:hypothetical protein
MAFYRIQKMDPAGYPADPDVSKALWRVSPQDPLTIETTAKLALVPEVFTFSDGRAASPSIDNWIVGNNQGVQKDPAAYRDPKTPSWLASLAAMGNHAQGLDCATVHGVLAEARKKPADANAARVLAVAAVKPLGMAMQEDPAMLCAAVYLCPKEPILPHELELKAVQLIGPLSPARLVADEKARGADLAAEG